MHPRIANPAAVSMMLHNVDNSTTWMPVTAAMDEEKRAGIGEYRDHEEYVEADDLDAFLPINNTAAEAEAALVTKRRIPWHSTTRIKHSAIIAINTACAVGLVLVNKHIFASPHIRHAQVAFAAMHFAITAGVLYAASSPTLVSSASRFGVRRTLLFERKDIDIIDVLPLALGMLASVVLTNASLAYSSIQFFQVVRVLTTPSVAAMEYLVFRRTIPLQAGLTLVPVCLGAALVSWFDTTAASASLDTSAVGRTTPLGILFAGLSLVAAATYTVLIKKSHQSTQCSSLQLLLVQSSVSVLLMLYIIPFSDDIMAWSYVSPSMWLVLLLSGILACGLHVTQFIIIDGLGPIASTVFGHFKTCLVIAIGWLAAGRSLSGGSLVGIMLAIGGIVAYSVVTFKQQRY